MPDFSSFMRILNHYTADIQYLVEPYKENKPYNISQPSSFQIFNFAGNFFDKIQLWLLKQTAEVKIQIIVNFGRTDEENSMLSVS